MSSMADIDRFELRIADTPDDYIESTAPGSYEAALARQRGVDNRISGIRNVVRLHDPAMYDDAYDVKVEPREAIFGDPINEALEMFSGRHTGQIWTE